MAAAGEIAMAERLMKETIRGLRFQNGPRQNFQHVSGDMDETFKVHVETPEVLALCIQKSGPVCITLERSGAFIAHVEGTIKRVDSNGNMVYQRSYRSDKGGYKEGHSLSEGDTMIIVMEAHHFVSAVVGQGSSEMKVTLKYIC